MEERLCIKPRMEMGERAIFPIATQPQVELLGEVKMKCAASVRE